MGRNSGQLEVHVKANLQFFLVQAKNLRLSLLKSFQEGFVLLDHFYLYFMPPSPFLHLSLIPTFSLAFYLTPFLACYPLLPLSLFLQFLFFLSLFTPLIGCILILILILIRNYPEVHKAHTQSLASHCIECSWHPFDGWCYFMIFCFSLWPICELELGGSRALLSVCLCACWVPM